MSSTDNITRLDRATYLEPSPYESDGGQPIGKHPKDVSMTDLRALGHFSPIRAIRAKCIDCSGNSIAEARKCTAVLCPLWAFRMGSNVFHSRSTAAQNEAGLVGV